MLKNKLSDYLKNFNQIRDNLYYCDGMILRKIELQMYIMIPYRNYCILFMLLGRFDGKFKS